MIIYMLLNLVTEKAYVGQTVNTLRERWNGHLEQARNGATAPIHVAMREWPDEWMWTQVVLQNCYSEDELGPCEAMWIDRCSTRDGSVGYNAMNVSIDPSTKNRRVQRTRKDMTAEEIEKFRQHGRKGARKKEDMTEAELERFREWGRRGAQKSRS